MNRLRLLLLLVCTLIVLYFGCQWYVFGDNGNDAGVRSLGSELLYRSPRGSMVVFEHVDVLSGQLERCISRSLDSHTVESCVDMRHPEKLRLAYVRMLFGALYLVNSIQDCENVLLIGLGAGSFATSLNHLAHSHPVDPNLNLHMDIVEVDKEVVAIAREWFGFKEGPSTTVHVVGGAEFLARSSPAAYNLIVIDAYNAEGRVPLSIGRREFVVNMRRALRPGGVAAINLYNVTDGSMQAWLRQEFGYDHVLELKDGNSVVVLAVDIEGNGGPAPNLDLVRGRTRRLESQFDSINIDTEWLLQKFAGNFNKSNL